VKFEGDRSNLLEVMISQTQEFGKAIRPLFVDPVAYVMCVGPFQSFAREIEEEISYTEMKAT